MLGETALMVLTAPMVLKRSKVMAVFCSKLLPANIPELPIGLDNRIMAGTLPQLTVQPPCLCALSEDKGKQAWHWEAALKYVRGWVG